MTSRGSPSLCMLTSAVALALAGGCSAPAADDADPAPLEQDVTSGKTQGIDVTVTWRDVVT